MRRSRRERGLSLVETLVSATLAVGVLGVTGAMVDASTEVARSTENQGHADTRVQRALVPLVEAIRRGSLGSARRLDGTNFVDGTSDQGFQIRPVLGFDGVPLTGELVTYRFDQAAGELLRSEGPIEAVLATGVTAFTASRTGGTFTFDVVAHSGPADARGRTAEGSMRATSRNP
jgi:hypothetical protein